MADELQALVFRVGEQEAADLLEWGWIGLVASSRGLRMVSLPAPTEELAVGRIREQYPDVRIEREARVLVSTAEQLREYLSGHRREFDVEVDLRGHTPFYVSVWSASRRIPYGETRSYGWIAEQVGGTGAAQAVGAALGANPIPLIIPCHRVIGSDGSLHGYAGGLEMKARLLALETGQSTLFLDLGE